MRRLTRYGVIVAAGMIAAGCTAGSQSSSTSGSGNGTKAATNSSLTISNESGQLWSCGFNPLTPSFTMLSYGFVYEPLVYVNPLQQGKTTPMLASSYAWSNGNKTLTFTIRSGVKWSDGTPMTANDVAYTGFTSLTAHPRVAQLIRVELDKVNRDLARVEQIKSFRILPKALDPEEEGEPVTPTRKVKRKLMYERFRELVEGMYDDREERLIAAGTGNVLAS